MPGALNQLVGSHQLQALVLFDVMSRYVRKENGAFLSFHS